MELYPLGIDPHPQGIGSYIGPYPLGIGPYIGAYPQSIGFYPLSRGPYPWA